MSIASKILSTAHTINQVRRAARLQCASLQEDRDHKGNYTTALYCFGVSSTISITGRRIVIGQKVYRQKEAIHPKDRKCTAPECWCCDGTGVTPQGDACTANNEPPF